MNRLPHLTQTDLHLTDEQFYALLDDSTPETASAHLSNCLDCQAEFATIRSSLANFRNATTSFAAIRTPALAQTASQRKTSASHRPIWAMAAAAAALLLGVSVSMHRNPAQLVTPIANVQPISQAESDDALLNDIERDLSTSVPPSLQPLQISASN